MEDTKSDTQDNADKKRKSSQSRCEAPKKRKSAEHARLSATDTEEQNSKNSGETNSEHGKSRLTIADLMFDYDRSQMRDPCLTPGRKVRPRYMENDIPPELKEHLLSIREIPKPEKPKGRLNWVQKTSYLEKKHS
jgi:hypothetical protein